MSGRYFLDTNVVVYGFDSSQPAKRARSRELVAGALGGAGTISFQVVQEFLNVALRKFATPMTTAEAREYLDLVLLPLCRVFPEPDLYREALALRGRWGFSLYHAMIVAAAIQGGCTTLFTEDLQDGQRIGELRIENPFR